MKITKEMLMRLGGKPTLGLLDPCVICGGSLVAAKRDQLTGELIYYEGHEPFNECGHSIEETAAVIKKIRSLKASEIDEILAAS